MGKCISKPAELPAAADKKKVFDNEVKPIAAAAAAGKGSDRSLQRLFDKDMQDEHDEEANGQLKRIPEEDEQEEHQVTEKASTLETVVENKHGEDAGKTKDQEIGEPGAADEVEERKLELPVEKEGTPLVVPADEIRSPVAAAEAPKETVEERPSTPEISESKLPPDEVVNGCQASDNVGEEQHQQQQAEDNNAELVKLESEKFELLVKQASEKFEIPGVPADEAVVTAGVPEASVGVAAARSTNEDVDAGKPSELTQQEGIEDKSAGEETPAGVSRPVETEMAEVKPHPDKAANGEDVAVVTENSPVEKVEITDVPAQYVPDASKDVGVAGAAVNSKDVGITDAQIVPSEAESQIAAERTSVTRHADKLKSKEEDAEVVDGPSETIEAVKKSSKDIAAPTESMSDMSVSEAAPMENEPEPRQQQEMIAVGAPATEKEPAQPVENDIAEEAKSEAPTETLDGEQATDRSTEPALQSDHDPKEVESQIQRVDTSQEGNGPENPQEPTGEKDEAEELVGKEESEAHIRNSAPEATCEAGSTETYAGQPVASAPAQAAAPIEAAAAADKI